VKHRFFSGALWIILSGSLFAPGFLGAQEGTGILTNARSGVFNAAQRLWFSVPDGEWLRVLQDGREAFRGPSPGALVLEVAPGTERDYEIVVERISVPPGERIYESRTYRITLDQKPPDPPVLALAGAAGGLSVLAAKTDDRSRVSALVDIRNATRYIPDISAMEGLPAASYAVVSWAVDQAGNYSDPAPAYLEFPDLQVLNPVPGTWANPQRLLLSGSENKEVLWTDDGSDPFDAGGRRYTGPVLINRTGNVTVRVGIRYADGRLREEAVSYTVLYTGTGGLPVFFNECRAREEGAVVSEFSLNVPAGYAWSMGGETRNAGGTSPVLRAEPLIKRYVPFHVSDGTGTYRFVFTLDGSRTTVVDPLALGPGPEKKREIRSLPVIAVSGTTYDNIGEPRLVSSGASRVVVWPRNTRVRYQLESNAAWVEGGPPVPVHPAGEILRWMVDRGGEETGPFYLRIEPVTYTAEREEVYAQGRFFYHYYSPAQERALGGGAQTWYCASDLMPFTAEIAARDSIDVCDGEDIEWRFITQEGMIRGSWRRDRLNPLPPVLDAPEEGAWVRGPLTVALTGGDGEAALSPHVTARLWYTTGWIEDLEGSDTLALAGRVNDIAEVQIEAYFEDASGNRSPAVRRFFTIDPSTLYVSSWRWETGEDPALEPGSRENPYVYLDDALNRARREQRRLICLSGYGLLRGTIEIAGDIEIDGSFDENWERPGSKAVIEMAAGAAIQVRGSLNLRDLTVERTDGADSLLLIRSGGVLVLDDSAVSHSGAFLTLENNGTCLIQYSSILSTAAGSEYGGLNRRVPVISAAGAAVTVRNSRWELEGEYGILASLQGGSFHTESCNFRVNTLSTGTAFVFSETSAEIRDLTLSVQARDYASALELTRSRLRMEGSRVAVSARDAVAVIAENTDAAYARTDFAVDASFVARGLEIRDRFPQVTGCSFSSTGPARRSEVFSAFRTGETRLGTLVPDAGAVAENSFQGFTHILGSDYPADGVQDFNRAFAPPGRPNISK
jgi:hypothetical protein